MDAEGNTVDRCGKKRRLIKACVDTCLHAVCSKSATDHQQRTPPVFFCFLLALPYCCLCLQRRPPAVPVPATSMCPSNTHSIVVYRYTSSTCTTSMCALIRASYSTRFLTACTSTTATSNILGHTQKTFAFGVCTGRQQRRYNGHVPANGCTRHVNAKLAFVTGQLQQHGLEKHHALQVRRHLECLLLPSLQQLHHLIVTLAAVRTSVPAASSRCTTSVA